MEKQEVAQKMLSKIPSYKGKKGKGSLLRVKGDTNLGETMTTGKRGSERTRP